MCGGGGGHTVRDPYQFPIRPTPWGQALGGKGRITGRQATEANPMCIISGGNGQGPAAHTPTITSRGSAGRGHMRGSMGGARKNFARLLARLGAHPLGEVVAGRMRLRDWARFQLDLQAHAPDCRYRRLLEAVRP